MGFGAIGVLILQQALSQSGRSYENVLTQDQVKKTHALKINIFMLEVRRAEKDFLARQEWKYVENNLEIIERIKAESQAWIELEKQFGHGDDVKVAESIIRAISQYQGAFVPLADSWKSKGLDENPVCRAGLETPPISLKR